MNENMVRIIIKELDPNDLETQSLFVSTRASFIGILWNKDKSKIFVMFKELHEQTRKIERWFRIFRNGDVFDGCEWLHLGSLVKVVNFFHICESRNRA